MVVLKKSKTSTLHDSEALKLNGVKSRISKIHTDGKAPPLEHSFDHQDDSATESEAGKWSENLIGRGKDLLSKDVSGVATAAAIVVGAALIEVELIPGLIIGAGAILLGKLFPEATHYVRPAIKGAVRAGFSATHKIREILAEANEQVNDLVAEVKNEQSGSVKQERNTAKPESQINALQKH